MDGECIGNSTIQFIVNDKPNNYDPATRGASRPPSLKIYICCWQFNYKKYIGIKLLALETGNEWDIDK